MFYISAMKIAELFHKNFAKDIWIRSDHNGRTSFKVPKQSKSYVNSIKMKIIALEKYP